MKSRYPSVKPSGSICHRHIGFDCSSPMGLAVINGTPGGTRTPDLLLRRQLLYPAELLARIDGAGDGNRTRVSSLEGWCSTIELHPRKSMIRPIQPVNSSTDFPRCQGETRIFSGAPETMPQYPTHSRNQEIPQTAEAASRDEHSSRKSTHRPELTVR